MIQIPSFKISSKVIMATMFFLLFNLSLTNAQHDHQMHSANDTLLTVDDYYKIVSVPLPNDVILEVGGMAQMPDGRLAVVTRMGKIWLIENPTIENNNEPVFTLFASGLHEPLGMSYKEGALYVAQRAELTKITDINGDDKADNFETITTWPLSGNYCEYNHGPVIGPDGNFYINFNLADDGMVERDGIWYSRNDFYGEMVSLAPWRGWMVKIDQEGKLTPYAAGLRSPAGIGTNSEGDIFYSENQGGWVGTGYLTHVEEGDFFGNPSSIKSAHLPESPIKIDTSYIPMDKPLLHELVGKVPGFKMPSVRFPHGVLGVSLSGFVADNTEGGFGPFQNQLFVGDEGHANIMRVFLEKVDGEYQGAVFPFRRGFASGVLRMEWAKDNSIFVGMSDRGWSSVGPDRYGLQRLVWTGKTPFEIKTIKAKPDGFELEFTSPVDAETANDFSSYAISGFDYAYQMEYGSDIYDKKKCKVLGVKLSEDGLTARLIVDNLREGYIHELKCEGIKSKEGLGLLHDYGYYSLNAIPKGEKLSLTGEGVVSVETRALAAKKAEAVKKQKKIAAAKEQDFVEKNQNQMPSSWKDGPDVTITIGVKPGLKYDIEKLNVKPNSKVKLVFVNNDDMQHNLLIVQPEAIEEVGQAALKLGIDGSGMHWVPESNKVLFHTKLLQPRSQETIYFTTPSKEGNYEYVCTYPGHYTLMRGIMVVAK